MAVWSILHEPVQAPGTRLDAEYYQPRYLRDIEHLNTFDCRPIHKLAFVTDGIHGSPDEVEDGGVRYLSAKCVKDNDFSIGDTLRISDVQHAANPRTSLAVDDVLVTTVGTIGNSAVVQPDLLPANSDRHLGIIRLHANVDVDPYFLSTFLNSELGRFQSLREATGNVQLNLFIEKIRMLLVPRLQCEMEVARLTRAAYAARLSASHHVSESEAAVITALSMQKLSLHSSRAYTVQLSSMFQADRFGAEFFMPAKSRAQEALAKGGSRPLSDYVTSVRQMWNPQSAGKQLVRNFDLTHALEPFLDERVEPREAHTIASTKKVLRHGDVVISRLRSYLKQIAIVRCDNTVPITGSSEFIVLRPVRDFRGETLLAFLRSEVVQTILTWSQDGTNHPRFDERVLLSIPVPDRLVANQTPISRPIEASIADRQTMLARLQDGRRLIESEILGY